MSALPDSHNISFVALAPWDFVPYELLLLADPSLELIQQYIPKSEVIVAQINGETIGVTALLPHTDDTVEIKNVAVAPELHGRGIGSALIHHALEQAAAKGFRTVQIGTANSSIGQLRLYQRLGFEITSIIPNFFIDNYVDPIFEDGIQATHMIMLSRQLRGNPSSESPE